MDKLEHAGRILARAFGYGSSWQPDNNYGMDRAWNRDGGEKTRRVQLGGTFEEDIPEADGALSIRKEVRLSSEKREASIAGVREFKRWSGERSPTGGEMVGPPGHRVFVESRKRRVGATATAITPKVGSGERAMIALAGIAKPLQSMLMLYATTDGRFWPDVDQFARACLPKSGHAGIEEAMFRVLKHASHRERAKRLRMRESAYLEMIRPALALFDECLLQAADEFAARYGDAKRLLDRIDQLSV